MEWYKILTIIAVSCWVLVELTMISIIQRQRQERLQNWIDEFNASFVRLGKSRGE